MAIPSLVLILALLLAMVSVVEPLAARLRLPSSVILALVGLVIGGFSVSTETAGNATLHALAGSVGALPLNSQVFLFIFLPALLFQGALDVDARDLMSDAAPIFMMAVVAVVLGTLAIGFVLQGVSGFPLLACLLVGAIVATTDPSAVIAIFRDLGAPRRLSRLVEGESLLNDAVAITLFAIVLDLLTTGESVRLAPTALRLVLVPLGGAAVGFIGGRLVAALFAVGGENRLVQASLTVALPYLAFTAAEHWHLSGPVAVATAGLTLSALGPARVSPSDWRYLKNVWDQLGFWAGSLVFVLAAILVPKLMHGVSWREAGWFAALASAALLARSVVLFGFLPLLTALRLSPAISRAYNLVMLWGGLRGAVTLALALAVTEHATLPEDLKRFVAVQATSLVLFTLLVQGTTLRPLMRALRMDRLSSADALLRAQALHLAKADVRQAIDATARSYGLSPEIAGDVARSYSDDGGAEIDLRANAAAIPADQSVGLGLAAVAAREHDLVLQHLEDRTVSPNLVQPLLAATRRLLDAARAKGAAGYTEEAERMLAYPRSVRVANMLHTRFGISVLLERRLGTRFETLLVHTILLKGLEEFAGRQLAALFGAFIGDAATQVLQRRWEATTRALDALRLQYPDYAGQLERRFLVMSAIRQERYAYDRLYGDGLIGAEVRRALLQSLAPRERGDKAPKLDLRLDSEALIRRVDLFEGLSDELVRDLCRLTRPVFGIPGERLITKGARGDAAWFIASGAVEVDTGREKVRLGRGDVFGELALLTGSPRTADVTAIAFCEMLILQARDFHNFLDRNPSIRGRIEAIAAERLGSARSGASFR
jgi:CPA1 family monovalent cation:H+ antiporter